MGIDLEKLAKEIESDALDSQGINIADCALDVLKVWHKDLMEKLPKRPEQPKEWEGNAILDSKTARANIEGQQWIWDFIMQHLRLDSEENGNKGWRISEKGHVVKGEKPVCKHEHTECSRCGHQLSGEKRPVWKYIEDKAPHPNYGLPEPNLDEPQQIKVPEKYDKNYAIAGTAANRINQIIDYLQAKEDERSG